MTPITMMRVILYILISATAPHVNGFLPPNRSIVRTRNAARYLYDDEQKPPRRRKDDIIALEQEVLDATRARLDMKRVNQAFLEHDLPGSTTTTTTTLDQWKVALAAGVVSAVAANLVLQSFLLSSMVCMAVFLVANGDPLEEDSVAGALARVVGRFTLQSVQASQPKVRAIARAAVRGDEEIAELTRRVAELEAANAKLTLWKQQRQAVDEALSDYNVDELKEKARANRIAIGGTKSQLLMRLVEAGIVQLKL